MQALVDVLHPVFEVGDIGPAGGIVFHVSNDRSHGLEAAPADQVSAIWGCLGTDIAEIENLTEGETVEGGTNGGVAEGGASEGGASEGGTNTEDNSGAANTNAIIATCEAGTAAAVARDYVWPNGETDGFLPNRDELNLLFAQESVVGGFTIEEAYLSSSEFDASFAWIESGSGQFPINKNTLFRVRAVRAF